MSLNALKEIVPVVYGTTGIKMWWNYSQPANTTCFTPHWHERIEVIRVQRGSIELQYEDEAYTATAGQTVVISPNRLHGAISGPSGVVYHILLFELATFGRFSEAIDEVLRPIAKGHQMFHPVYDDPTVTAAVDRLLQNRLSEDPLAVLAVTGDLYHLLSILCTTGLLQASGVSVKKAFFSEIVDYVDDHLHQPLSTKNLARHFGYSESYFCRRFKIATGLPLLRYIQIQRLEKAQHILSEGRHSIGTVAAKCGFSDISNFSRCFHAHYGITPSDFVRANKRIHQYPG